MKAKERIANSVFAVLICSCFYLVKGELKVKDKVDLYVNQQEKMIFDSELFSASFGYDVAVQYSSFSREGLDSSQFN